MTRKERLRNNMKWEILAEIDDHLFIAEDLWGDSVILHFYEDGIDETPMVEGFLPTSFNGDKLAKFYGRPQQFLEEFSNYVTNAVPNWKAKESEWLC